MRTSDFDYSLPTELIAQTPAEPRDSSRLMVLHRETERIEERRFSDIGDYLNPGDLLVFNDTRVIPARLPGARKTGGRVELLLLRKRSPDTWEALVKPGRVRDGEVVFVSGNRLEAEIGEGCGGGVRVVRFSRPELVGLLGQVPLPPYIHQPLSDAERYQTVYARVEGSAAAPTAGLHFTAQLMQSLAEKGVRSAFVTLHIGLDTFRPVRDEDPCHHQIHSEYVEVSAETADLINRTKGEGGRIICVGTTSVRTVEGVAAANQGVMAPYGGKIDLFVLPGFRFGVTDVMVTNFHLPRTTLLMLTSAFAGREFILRAYREAIERRYRFYSFGDAMLILR